MSKYLAELSASDTEDMVFRNRRMTENIDQVVATHPQGKKLVIVGNGHVKQSNDIDESLRAKGHQTTTVEINNKLCANRRSDHEEFNPGTDNPDIIIDVTSGQAISYKDTKTGDMKTVLKGIELPWRNTEPVAKASRADLGTLPPQPPPKAQEKAIRLPSHP